MCLAETVTDLKGKEYKMIGCIPGKIIMTNRLVNFGYKTMGSFKG